MFAYRQSGIQILTVHLLQRIFFNILSTSQSGSILIKIFQTKPKRPLDQQLPRHDLLGNTQHCTIRRVHPGEGSRLQTTNISTAFSASLWKYVKWCEINSNIHWRSSFKVSWKIFGPGFSNIWPDIQGLQVRSGYLCHIPYWLHPKLFLF